MISRGNKRSTSNTDYSSEPELFFSSLHGKPHQSRNTERSIETKIKEESASLIQHAARLELESITLKESIEKAGDNLKEFHKADLQELSASMKDVKKDVASIKTKTNTSEDLLRQGLEKVAVNSELTYLLQNSTTNQEKLCHIVDGKIQTLESSVKNVLAQTEFIRDKQSQQNEAISEISKKFETIDGDISDMKQFLSLLVPRLMTLEKLFVPILSQVNATPQRMVDSDTQTQPKRRKLE